ncbi:hypothetical protein HELRODRAFT_165672 [Helobdella robusta]|uniref:PH domain-containing protein n=1 Tax=Helobdella robusta TaxID=6412 RepID=T1EX55_HELRO|nr:hypothetical protein HELRODRAFT_165672 [Helobdella robusta]ESN91618.1 hypothetical protein HELRODRAFT_165672 [Helobdella robusta]
MSALMDRQCIDSNQKNSPNVTGNIAECSPMDNKDVDASSLGPLKSGMGLFGMLVKKPVPPPKQTLAKTNNNQIRLHHPVFTKLSLLPVSTTSNSLTTTPTKTLTAAFKPLTGNTITAISTTTTTTTTESNNNLLAVTTAATIKTAIKGPATFPKPMVKQQNNNNHIDNSSDSPKSNSSSSINISNDEKAEITQTALHIEDGYEYDDPMAVDMYNLSKNINNTNNKPTPEEDVLYDEIHVRSELETQVLGPTNPFVSDVNRTAEEDDCYASFPYSDSDHICYEGNSYINNSCKRNINTYSSLSLKKSALNDSNNIKSMVICPEKNDKIDDEGDEIYYKYDLAQPVIPEKKFPNRIPPLMSLSKFFDSSACNFDSIEMDINNNSISEISYDDFNDTVKPVIPEKTRNLSNQLSNGDQTSLLSSVSSYDDKDDEDDNEVDVEAVRLYNCQTRRRWWYENVEQYSRVTEEDASQRQLLKQNLVVELVENQRRKLRNLLLFDDVIVCAKQKRNNKFLVRWFITLDAIKVEFSTEEDEKNLLEHKTSMKKLNKEYKDCLEAIKCDGRMKMTAADNPKIKKSSEANKKKLNEMVGIHFGRF